MKMSLYTVQIQNRTYHVNISRNKPTVNGEPIDAEMFLLNANGLHMLRHGPYALELFLSKLDDETCQVMLRGGQRVLSRISTRATRKRTREADTSVKSLLAPMHGLVVEVFVQEGAEVEKNQTLVVLESMKMQMQLRSPRSGKVRQVTVKPGNQVEKGALLVEFE
jgi:biotin carboxyl carrier protein